MNWKLTSFGLAALFAVNAMAEPQPLMRDALVRLQSAEQALQRADHDKGGHRVKALELTQAAIAEVRAGIKFDNRH